MFFPDRQVSSQHEFFLSFFFCVCNDSCASILLVWKQSSRIKKKRQALLQKYLTGQVHQDRVLLLITEVKKTEIMIL